MRNGSASIRDTLLKSSTREVDDLPSGSSPRKKRKKKRKKKKSKNKGYKLYCYRYVIGFVFCCNLVANSVA